MNLVENIREGVRSIKGNVLRTVLTALIIAIGITSLVGILTAVDGIQKSVNSTFAELGSNTFTIVNNANPWQRNRGRSTRINPPITYRQATTFASIFKEKYEARVSVYANVSGAVEVQYGSQKTNPNINVLGAEADSVSLHADVGGSGRHINRADIENTMEGGILGPEIGRTRFGTTDTVGQHIT